MGTSSLAIVLLLFIAWLGGLVILEVHYTMLKCITLVFLTARLDF